MEQFEITNQVKKYIQTPIWLSFCLVGAIPLLYVTAGKKAAYVGVGMLAVYLAITAVLYQYQRVRLANELISFAAQYGQVQHRLIQELVLPYALLDLKGGVLWMNDEFAAIAGRDVNFHKNVAAIFPEISNAKLPGKDRTVRTHRGPRQQQDRLRNAQP